MKRLPLFVACGLILAACASDPSGPAVDAKSITASRDGQTAAPDSAAPVSLGGQAMGSGN